MNVPRHHFPEDVLLDYATGNALEAVALAVACHASFCSSCREQIRFLEDLGGAMIDTLPAVAVREDALERLLARLGEVERPMPRARRAVAPPGLELLPAPLWPYLQPDASREWPRFKPIVDGIQTIELSIAPVGGSARLVALDPSLIVPQHDHSAPEYGVLFQGGLSEPDGTRFHRGDAFHRVPGEPHTQAVLPGPACIALVVNEGSLLPLTPEGAVLHLFNA